MKIIRRFLFSSCLSFKRIAFSKIRATTKIVGKCTAFYLLLFAQIIAEATAAPTVLKPVEPGIEAQQAFQDLARYYAGKSVTWPDYKPKLLLLNQGDTKTSQSAARYVLALFEQSFADETNGRTERIAGPSNEAEANTARKFREAVATDFSSVTPGDESLALALWLVEHDTVESNIEVGMRVLLKINTKASNETIIKLLSEPHPNEFVLLSAINEAQKRNLLSATASIINLEQSYRLQVRNAAKEAAVTMGETTPAPYTPLNSFSPRIQAFLQKSKERMLVDIPSDATWLDGVISRGANSMPFHGWSIKTKTNEIVLFDYFGQIRTSSSSQNTLSAGSLTKAVLDLVELRAKIASDSVLLNSGSLPPTEAGPIRLERDRLVTELSDSHDASGYPPPPYVHIPEITLAVWCWERGDLTNAAKVLFPCYSASPDDRVIDSDSRDLLGAAYYQKLLNEFTLYHNYDEAYRLASHIAQPSFDGFYYQDQAVELAQQLRHRSEDFTTLTLPSQSEWTALKDKLSRHDQIIYLASRLKLLHCVQINQPGLLDYRRQQIAPTAITSQTSFDSDVINPYVELEQLKLQIADLRYVVPFASDMDFMPSYSFDKSFTPRRSLHRVCWAIGDLINRTVGYDIVTHNDYGGLYLLQNPHAELSKALSGWIASSGGMTQAQLLEESLKSSADWIELHRSALSALQQGKPELLKVLAKRIGRFPSGPNSDIEEGELMHLIFESQAPVSEEAREWLLSPNQYVRFWASLIIIRNGKADMDKALEKLESILKNPSDWKIKLPILDSTTFLAMPLPKDSIALYILAAPTLLASKNPAVRNCADSVFDLRYEIAIDRSGVDGSDMLKRFCLSGDEKGMAFILRELDTYVVDPDIQGSAVTEVYYSNYLVQMLCQWRSKDQWQKAWSPNADQREFREELKQWLEQQFKSIREGKRSEIVPPRAG